MIAEAYDLDQENQHSLTSFVISIVKLTTEIISEIVKVKRLLMISVVFITTVEHPLDLHIDFSHDLRQNRTLP